MTQMLRLPSKDKRNKKNDEKSRLRKQQLPSAEHQDSLLFENHEKNSEPRDCCLTNDIKTLKLILNYNGESSPLGIQKSFAKATAVVQVSRIQDSLLSRTKKEYNIIQVLLISEQETKFSIHSKIRHNTSTSDITYLILPMTHVLHFFRYSSIFVIHHILLRRGTVVPLFHQSLSRTLRGIIHLNLNFYLTRWSRKCSEEHILKFLPKKDWEP